MEHRSRDLVSFKGGGYLDFAQNGTYYIEASESELVSIKILISSVLMSFILNFMLGPDVQIYYANVPLAIRPDGMITVHCSTANKTIPHHHHN